MGTLVALVLGIGTAGAHEGRPVHVQITEREPGLFLVQWRVPTALPVQAMPEPVLPGSCAPEGEHVVVDGPGSRLSRRTFRCEEGLAGQAIGIRYPLHNPSLTTLLRVDLLSGDRHAHALGPGENAWEIPRSTAGGPEALLHDAQHAVLFGASHILDRWVHLVFLLVLGLLGGLRRGIRVVTVFAAGQVLAVGLSSVLGLRFAAAPAEIIFAVAVVFLAHQSLRPAGDGRQIAALAAGAGLFHGLGLASLMTAAPGGGDAGLVGQLLMVLGMDTAQLGVIVVLVALGRLAGGLPIVVRFRPVLAYAGGGAAVALVLVLVAGNPVAGAKTNSSSRLPGNTMVGAVSSGSQRVAPRSPDAPVKSFVAIGPFEVRHEVLIRIRDAAGRIDLAPGAGEFLEVDAQPDVAGRLADFVATQTLLGIDGETAEPIVDGVDFMTVGDRGALPRENPVRERLDEAFVGVVLAYPAAGMPEQVTLTWSVFPDAGFIPATAIDPESSFTSRLTPRAASLTWENRLTSDPLPTVAAVPVEPPMLPVPLLSVPLLAVAMIVGVMVLRGRRRTVSFAALRVLLAVAVLAGPLGNVAVALPRTLQPAPSEGQARRILAGLLPNIYRALEHRWESAIYDRLAVSVTGETLTEVYLEHRRALEMAERGGARARVEAVEMLQVNDVEQRPDEGFEARAVWIVGGTVTHFGHRHFRQNRYDARIDLVPVEGTWKIRSMEVLDEQRVR
jgi:hypothetical protein